MKNTTCQIILYIHGGAFTSGSFKAYGGFVSELAHRAESRLLFVQYRQAYPSPPLHYTTLHSYYIATRQLKYLHRLAPEWPLPAAKEDVLAAYEYLLRERIDPERIVWVGDSAGGGLLLMALHAFQTDKSFTPLPRGAVTFSAWTGYSPSSRSHSSLFLFMFFAFRFRFAFSFAFLVLMILYCTDLYTSKEQHPSYATNKDNDAVLKATWLNQRALLATGVYLLVAIPPSLLTSL